MKTIGKSTFIFLLLGLSLTVQAAIPTGKLGRIIRRGLELDPHRLTRTAIIQKEKALYKVILNNIKDIPKDYGYQFVKEAIDKMDLNKITNEHTINLIIQNHYQLLKFVKTIKKYGSLKDIKSFAANIKHVELQAIDFTRVTINPFLLTGLGRTMDLKVSSLSKKVSYIELQSIAQFSHQLISANTERKEDIKSIIDSALIIASDTKLSIFKGFDEPDTLIYGELNTISNALLEIIQELHSKPIVKKINRTDLQKSLENKLK